MPEIMFGTNIQFAAKRWPEPEQWTAVVADLGIEFVQFSLDVLDPFLAGDPRRFDEVRQAAEDRGIEIPSAFTGSMIFHQNLLADPRDTVRDQAEEWFRCAIDAAARLGAQTMGGYLGGLTIRQFADPQTRAAGIRRMHESLLRLTDSAAKAGLDCLVFEVQPNEREHPAHWEDVEAFAEYWASGGAVPIKLCLDLGHACLPGGSISERDPYAWLTRFGSYTRIVNLQQTDGVQDRHWPFTAEFNKQGIIDPERVMSLVDQFEGAVELMFEIGFRHDVPEQKVLEALETSISHWRPAVDARRSREL